MEAVGTEFFIKQVRGETDTAGMDESARAFVRSMVDGTAVRTKYFDEYFLESVSAGIRQVVILASGLDARAYRLPWPEDTSVYEIDQPQVISFKTATLARLDAEPRATHRVVPIDLRNDWPAALREAGFDAAAPAAWSAEGLLQYLPPEAQDLLLDNLTQLSATGSAAAVDYNVGPVNLDASDGADISSAWREEGFTIDMSTLTSTAERVDAVEYLMARGWQISRQPIGQLFWRYGMEYASDSDNDPLADVVYACGTLVPSHCAST